MRGAVELFAGLEREFDSAELHLRFVVNDVYVERIQRLIERLGNGERDKRAGLPALQILTRVRGEPGSNEPGRGYEGALDTAFVQ